MSRILTFGPYKLIERIGVGAMGEVYRAVASDGRVVALKRLMASANGNEEAVAMLESEAELARFLDHPSISRITDAGNVGGVHYIAYEYVHGRDLRSIQNRVLRRSLPPVSRRSSPDLLAGPTSPRPDSARPSSPPLAAVEVEPVALDVSIYVVLRVAQALAHAHERKDTRGQPLHLVHRDVSPTNILVSFDGAVKLLDFGIARAAGRMARTDTRQVKGTVGYMSPEQVRGEGVDPRSDIYSLGICLWELCTGKKLLDPSLSPDATARVLAGEVRPPRALGAKISAGLEEAVLKALAESPQGRYATATEFHDNLYRQASAEGLVADSGRVARYVRSLFPEAAAEEAARREESRDMAENKGGSDLDVFEGLAKKASRPTNAGLTPPPRKSTLMGGLAPLPPPVAPPPSVAKASVPPLAMPPVPAPPTSSGLPPPMPPPKSLPPGGGVSAKSGTLPGLSAPPLPPGALPPPSKIPPPSSLPTPPPVTTPSATAGTGPSGTTVLPALTPPPPARADGASKPPAPPAPSAPPGPPPPAATAPGVGAPGSLPPLPPLPAPPQGTTKSLAPLPPPTAPPQKSKAAVDMDWDDEEESTHVYDKADGDLPMPPPKKGVGAAAALLAGSGGAARSVAPTAPAAPSVPPPPPPIPVAPATEPMRSRDEPTAIRPRAPLPPAAQAGSSNRMGILLGGAAFVVALIVLGINFLPKKGSIKINVAARGGAPVGAVNIFLDGQPKCVAAPCVVSDLEVGAKTITVTAPGYQDTVANEMVESGKEKVINIQIEQKNAAGTGSAPPATGSTGSVASADATELRIPGTEGEHGVHVFVDGTDKGTLPADLRDLPAGSHKIRFEGDRYEKTEQTVELAAGQPKDLDVKLKVLKGQVTLDVVTKDVAITLVRRGDKKTEKKITDAMLKTPPVRLDIDTSENWRLVATKKGFDDFTQDLTFEDGQADKTVKIELFETGKPQPPPVAVGGPISTPTPPPVDKGPAAASGTGTLNINSIPVSRIVLDGKPLGSTPKVGVSVPAGSHTVTFIHPDLGKQSVTVQVKNGETKTAAVKFKQ